MKYKFAYIEPDRKYSQFDRHQIDTLINMYDFATPYIDDLNQQRKAESKNKTILKKLAKYGVVLKRYN